MNYSKRTHSAAKGQTQPEAVKQERSRLGKILVALFAIATLLGGTVAAFAALAGVTVNILPPLQPSKAFSAPFAVVNNGIVTLNHVNLMVGICRVDMNLSGAFDPRRPRAVTIRGDGAKFTPGSAGCTGPNGARFYNQNWTNHELEPQEKFSTTLDPVLDWLVPLQARDSVTVTSAVITIVVQFQPWIIPWRREAEFRFATQKVPDGTLRWFGSSLENK
jgi:hypothetical protein